MVAALLSSKAREGHQEDDGDPPIDHRWKFRVDRGTANEHTALVSKTVLGMRGKGGITSGFKTHLEFVAFGLELDSFCFSL